MPLSRFRRRTVRLELTDTDQWRSSNHPFEPSLDHHSTVRHTATVVLRRTR